MLPKRPELQMQSGAGGEFNTPELLHLSFYFLGGKNMHVESYRRHMRSPYPLLPGSR